MAAEFGGTVRFVEENYGDSAIAGSLGVSGYPAIFVDDVLVATPRDFGFGGTAETAGSGRYLPFKNAASHERFRADLARMIDLIVEGRKDSARAQAAAAPPAAVATLPALTLADLEGRTLAPGDFAGRAVLVEFWATWCPPCRSTLAWLGELKKIHGNRLVVVAIAVHSAEAEVRRVAADMKLPIVWTFGTPEVVRTFGDVSAVPTLFLFGGDGRAAAAYYGAPPTLHAEAEAALGALLR